MHIVASYPRRIGPGRYDVSPICGLYNLGGRGRHLEVLEQLNATSDGLVLLGHVSLRSVAEPFWNRRPRGQTVDGHIIASLNVHGSGSGRTDPGECEWIKISWFRVPSSLVLLAVVRPASASSISNSASELEKSILGTLGRATTTASSPSLNMPLHNDNYYFGYASLMLTRATFFIAFEHSGWSVRVVTRKAPA